MIVAGHGLRREGRRVYDAQGNYDPREGTHGKCRCGLLFHEPSDNAVRRKHREHKEQVILQRSGGAT